MKKSELYRWAGERVAVGWCQKVANDGFGNVCAFGAMISVYGEIHVPNLDNFGDEVLGHALVVAPMKTSDDIIMHPLAQWNDAKGRTQEEVILAFKHAEAAALERGE